MTASPTPFDTEASAGSRRAIIRRNPGDPGELEMIGAIWGSNQRFTDGVDYRFVRGEGKAFSANRCLIPASEFRMTVGDRRYRASLDCGNWFYLAGLWEAGEDGLVHFRIVTVYANADIVDYQQRHGALILRRQRFDWLDGLVPASELLVPPPARTFHVERIGGRQPRRQGELAI